MVTSCTTLSRSAAGKMSESETSLRNESAAPRVRLRAVSVGLLVGVAALGTFLVTPRPTRPRFVPLPVVDHVAIARLDREGVARAVLARETLLPARARLVGEEFRRFNRARARGTFDAAQLERELTEDVRRLIEQDAARELLDLRALQSELFVQAVHQLLATGKDSEELVELGGEFSKSFTASWLDEDGRSTLDDAHLRLFFRVRWGLVTDTHRLPGFGPTLDEERLYYALLIQRPEAPSEGDPALRAVARLGYVNALARIDPAYPADLARGIALLDAQRPEEAIIALRAHVTGHPTGPWALLARNHLLAALRSVPEY